jgi:hypothetical protein
MGYITHQLVLVLDGQGGVGEDRRQVDLVLLLDVSLSKGSLPLVGETARSVVLFQDGNLLASLLERVDACLELLLVLVGVLAADKDLDRDLAALEGLEVGSCRVLARDCGVWREGG